MGHASVGILLDAQGLTATRPGRPLFTDLSPDEIEAIQHYVRKHARAAIAAQKSQKSQKAQQ